MENNHVNVVGAGLAGSEAAWQLAKRGIKVENKIDVMTIFDTNYPLLLKEIYDPPVVMYTIGNQALLQTNMLAVVGSREMTSLGRSSIDTLLPELIEKQWTIVSGIAAGVDTNFCR